GTAALGNTSDGVRIQGGASVNTVGGTATGAANLISGNGRYGVVITDTGTSGNVVLGKLIGTDANGTADLGNAGDGVVIDGGATANTEGGTTAGASNVISGNFVSVVIFNAGTSGNVVLGNYIGTDVNGTAALGNLQDGVNLQGGASAN